MPALLYQPATESDIESMAEIRAGDWGSAEFWRPRILRYMRGESHPQSALRPRIVFVCVDSDRVLGLIAGHLTQRFGCDGELQWISVRPEERRRGIASELLRYLAEWFVANQARRVCVDATPENASARRFYLRHGAEDLRPGWMVWNDIRTALKAAE